MSTANLGLALSGGGSRAAAFHRGTLRAMIELGLVEKVDVVSTVSGGSVFGGAWMAARADNRSDSEFLDEMKAQLERGFIFRAAAQPWQILKALTPFTGYSRTNALAEAFDKIFFHGKTLEDLPKKPRLCINTTVMNSAQVGKFSRDGFSTWGLRQRRGDSKKTSQIIRWDDFSLALAVSASAAFPVGLPPIVLARGDFPNNVEFTEKLSDVKDISLTDGGVLENLGIQSLLVDNSRFSCWNVIVSDAGTLEQPWGRSAVRDSLRGAVVFVASGRTLDRIMIIMNDKENRWARQQVIGKMYESWMAEELRRGSCGEAMTQHLRDFPDRPRRNVLFIRVAQDWDNFLSGLSWVRLVELNNGSEAGIPKRCKGFVRKENRAEVANEVRSFLKDVGVDLSEAEEWHSRMSGVGDPNSVATSLTALSGTTLDLLEAHAAWQVHATHAIYGI